LSDFLNSLAIRSGEGRGLSGQQDTKGDWSVEGPSRKAFAFLVNVTAVKELVKSVPFACFCFEQTEAITSQKTERF
jgi:hypothetical protein